MKILLMLATLTVALSAQARIDRTVPLVFTIKATVLLQNHVATTNGAVVTTAAPLKYSLTTPGLLVELALEEFNESNYFTTNFPAGSKLVYLLDLDDSSKSYFYVEDGKGRFVCDVSDIINFSTDSNPTVQSGGVNLSTGRLSSEASSYELQFNYDETGAGGTLAFYLSGIAIFVSNDVVANNGVNYTRTISGKVSGMTGSGKIGKDGLTISGSTAVAGKASF